MIASPLLPGYPEDQSMRIGVVTFCHWIYVAARLCRYRLPHLVVPTGALGGKAVPGQRRVSGRIDISQRPTCVLMQADSPWQRGTEGNGHAFCDSIFQGASVLFLQDHGGGAAERSRVAE